MTPGQFEGLHSDAIGLKLHRVVGERLTSCEAVFFNGGRVAVDTVLRRAVLAGRVEIEGEIKDHFADVLTDENESCEQTIALDAKSYVALKGHWMRCRLARSA